MDTTDIFDLLAKDQNFQTIMKRLLEASIMFSFNGIMITEAGEGYPIVYVNDAFCEMTGYGPHEVAGRSPAMLQGPKTDPAVLDRLRRDLDADRLFHGRAVNYRKDGTEFVMEWKIVPIRGDEERITHYLAIQRDVTPVGIGGPA